MNAQKIMLKLGLLMLAALMAGCATDRLASADNSQAAKSPAEEIRIARTPPQKTAAGGNEKIKPVLIADTVAEENAWLGKYEHEEMGGKELFQLEIMRKNEKLTAVFRAVGTATIVDQFWLSVQIKGNVTSFYYQACRPLTAAESAEQAIDPCEDQNYQADDLMFRMVRKTDARKRSFFDPKSEKYDLHGPFYKVRKFMGE